ncbi:MAG: glycosyltransferase family 2 protein, partial [Flavobacteriales bacterium]
MPNLPQISIVVPVYRAENTLWPLFNQIKAVLSKLNFEIILVDDCGGDDSWEVIEAICAKHPEAKGLRLSRNFGQHAAITAGLERVSGEYVVVMDCDLQDDPAELPKLYKHIKSERLDIVLARRTNRQDSFKKRMGSKYFYKVLSFFTNTEQDSSVANYGIYTAQAIQEVCRMGDYVRFFPLFIRWVGFDLGYLDINHQAREDGSSNYTFRKLWQLAIDNIISFSNKPLYLTVNLGVAVTVLSFFGMVLTLFRYFLGQIEVLGYTSLILIITMFFGIVISI